MERYMQIRGGVLGTVGTVGTVCISDVPVYIYCGMQREGEGSLKSKGLPSMCRPRRPASGR